MFKNPIIVFEGIETSGKSTNLKKTIKYFKKKKIKYISFREPGGTNISEKLRQFMLNKKSKLNNKTDLFLLMASRSENFDKIIKNNYKKKVILIDRFIDSTLAYQHYGMGLDLNLINSLNKKILNKIKIDHIFFHNVKINTMIKRVGKRKFKNRYDIFKADFYKKVQFGYNKIFKKMKNITTIDSNRPLDENTDKVIKKIAKLV